MKLQLFEFGDLSLNMMMEDQANTMRVCREKDGSAGG
jgi:hypothetical protein